MTRFDTRGKISQFTQSHPLSSIPSPLIQLFKRRCHPILSVPKPTVMKQFFILALFVLCLNVSMKTNAQGIYQYWGTSVHGGNEGQGALFTTRMDGGGLKSRGGLTVATPGALPTRTKPVVYNGKIYCITRAGGLNNDGTIIAYDPVTTTYQKVAEFFTIQGKYAAGNLVVYNDKLYGICQGDGITNKGLIFEFNPATNTLVKKFDFAPTGYSQPLGGLVLDGTLLWGTTAGTGGCIYSYDISGGQFTMRNEFGGVLGTWAYGRLVLFNNKLYGVTRVGGANNFGVFYEYNIATDVYTVRAPFAGGNSGAHPEGSLTVFNNKIYGQAAQHGANGQGTIFEFDPATNIFTTKHQYTDAQGGDPLSGFTVYNNRLYAFTRLGGDGNNGTLVEYNPINNTLLKKMDCAFTAGERSDNDMVVYNDKLYGMMTFGGFANGQVYEGTFIEYDPEINGIQVRIRFRNNTGLEAIGSTAYLNGKVYGVTSRGGMNGNHLGVLWEYDLSTYTYSVRHHFETFSGYAGYCEGLIAYNGNLYGTAEFGGLNGNAGTLFRYNPGTGVFLTLHEFDNEADGGNPKGRLVVVNNKIYGTTLNGGGHQMGGGSIWEYDLNTNQFAKRVSMSPVAFGRFVHTGLTEFNGHLYGVAMNGGVNDRGTLFRYTPGINAFLKLHDFDVVSGAPAGGLTMANNKLYGVSENDFIYEYDPATDAFNIKDFLGDINAYTISSALTYNADNGKLYGTTTGSANDDEAVVFEFDPVANELNRTGTLTPAIGNSPQFMRLEKTPAFVAPGTPGSCVAGGSVNVDAGNNNTWLAFTNTAGDAVAEINANGNNLGRVVIDFYVHDGATRQKNGFYYLDRNISISVDNPPVTPVSVRLYIRKTEFEKLKNTPGSGIANIGNLRIYKNADACSNILTASASEVPTNVSAWGGDYVFSTEVTSFSSFYFASSMAVLPIHLLSFAGTTEAAANKLTWKASCTNDVDFTIERSVDGSHFQPVGLVMALQQDCAQPFVFMDQNAPAKAWYRLAIKEHGAPVKYSNIILLDRSRKQEFMLQVAPNPIAGNEVQVQISTASRKNISLTLIDALGRVNLYKQLQVQPGINSIVLPAGNLVSGVYYVRYDDGEKSETVRFIKK